MLMRGGNKIRNYQVRVLMERCQQDPVWFAENVLGVRLWKKQREQLRALTTHRRVAVRSCHGAGKTFVAAVAVLWFLFCFPDSRVLTTAPTFRQVEKVLWQEVRKLHEQSIFPLGGKVFITQIQVQTGWFALGFSTDNPDAFQGHHAKHMLVIFDEACGIPDEIWDAADGVLTGRHAVLFAIGNPTDPDTRFGEEFKNPQTYKMKISAFDTPNFTNEFGEGDEGHVDGLVTPVWVEDKRERWGEDSPIWQCRVLGDFPPGASDALIPLSWIERAQATKLEPDGRLEFGVDVARHGDAETVIYGRRGGRLRLVKAYRGLDTAVISKLLIDAIIEKDPATVRIDEVGVGAGVLDNLKAQLDYRRRASVRGINVGMKPYDQEHFLNLRAEIYWDLRQRFEEGTVDIDPRDEELAAQLSKLKYDYNPKGKIRIESKKQMKRRNLPSPDRADAAALAFARIRSPLASREIIL